MSALAVILMAGMAVPGNGPEKVSGEVEFNFTGTKWILETGYKGTTKLLKASVRFKTRNEVEISWRAGSGENVSYYGCTCTYKYCLDPRSRLPMIPPPRHLRDLPPNLLDLLDLRERVSFQLEGSLLRVEIVGGDFDIHCPQGMLLMTLRQDK